MKNDKSQSQENQKQSAEQPRKSSVASRVKGAIDERKNLESKIEELTDALQRERADVINIRRRHEGQIASLKTTVKADVVRDLLPAIDNLERALMHVPKDIESHDYVKGIQGVVKQFEKVFKDLGVTRIKTVGEEFDPSMHEAISMEEGEGSREIVAKELQAGYKLGDEVIRHAMVNVRTEE